MEFHHPNCPERSQPAPGSDAEAVAQALLTLATNHPELSGVAASATACIRHLLAETIRLQAQRDAERKAWEQVHAAVGLGYPDPESSHADWLDNANETRIAVEKLQAQRDEAVAAERERCAQIAMHFKGGYSASLEDDVLLPDPDGPWALGSDIAAAIRRGTP